MVLLQISTFKLTLSPIFGTLIVDLLRATKQKSLIWKIQMI